jgi:hypothetical protein
MLAERSLGDTAMGDQVGHGDLPPCVLPDKVDRLLEIVRKWPAALYPAKVETIGWHHGA